MAALKGTVVHFLSCQATRVVRQNGLGAAKRSKEVATAADEG